jgi:hypothetical protein
MDMRMLREEIEARGLTGTYAEMAAALNERPLVENPTPQGTVLKRVRLMDVMGLLTDAEKVKAKDIPAWLMGFVIDALQAGDMAALAAHMDLLVRWQFIGAETVGRIRALLAETEPDPAWQAMVAGQSWAEATLGRRVTEVDVQAAMNRRESDDAE